jgi:hypothetical protein
MVMKASVMVDAVTSAVVANKISGGAATIMAERAGQEYARRSDVIVATAFKSAAKTESKKIAALAEGAEALQALREELLAKGIDPDNVLESVLDSAH